MSFTASRPCVRLPIFQALQVSRNLSSSLSLGLNRVPPESPSYIRLPTPPQSDEAKPTRVRGHLPIPREIFPRLEGDKKVHPEYIQRTAPRPAKSREETSAEQRWNAALADSRRTNLKNGLDSLWTRRFNMDKSRNERVGRRFQQHNKASAAPDREDDRLTQPTILGSIMDTKLYPDPDRFSRADRSRTKVLALEKSKHEARRDALMELYISASSFIVHENELKAEIDKVFAEDYFRQQSRAAYRHGATENTWGVYGRPPSVANMMETSVGASTKVMDFDESEYDRSVKRQKRIAEDLTGGKME
ncbi:hypothetical protein QQS21_003178 [Conoideocrella luteorostrata]|uniref:37S ribosomal protein S25, mitochondrial n=1 Tax=Conoideocrella luteorostrata TaxID=1105319 RepID=A0AAJ0CTM4_9HYPO|nr:hypothetical protein QQS21_003178 [Conoideocrella luteorostrata]